ncbi:MAG: hypothetical protein ACK4RZ_03005 [Paracoccaceae bacterium]
MPVWRKAAPVGAAFFAFTAGLGLGAADGYDSLHIRRLSAENLTFLMADASFLFAPDGRAGYALGLRLKGPVTP